MMEIQSGPAVLRQFRPYDAGSLAQHANSRAIWLGLRDGFPHPYALSDAEAYIASVLARPRPIKEGEILDQYMYAAVRT